MGCKKASGNRGMMHLRTNAGFYLVGSLEVYLSGTFLFVLPIGLQRRLSSLLEATTRAVLTFSQDLIHIQNGVSILVCIYSCYKCTFYISSLIFNVLLATSPRIYKHII